MAPLAQPAGNRYGVWLYRGMVIFLWVLVTGLFMEAVFYIQTWRIEHTNPYIRSWRDGAPWPVPLPPKQAWTLSEEALAAATAQAAETVSDAVVQDNRADRTRRAEFFTEIDESQRERFAALYQVVALICERDGQVVGRYPKFLCLPGEVGRETPPVQTLAAVLGPSASEELRPPFVQAIETGQPAVVHLSTISMTVFLYPEKNLSRLIVFVDNPPKNAPPVPPGSIWEIPFLTCKKQVSSPDGKYRTNNFGFRDDDVIVPKPKGLFRIVCVGGSTTEEGDTNAMTYPNLLERKLRREFGDRVEVVNCGLSGMNSLKEWMRSADYLALEPDFVVYYNAVNDICHTVYPQWVTQRAGKIARLFRRIRFVNYYGNRWLLPSNRAMAADFDREIMANLRYMQAYFAHRGIPMAMCSFACPDINALTREERVYYDWSCEKNWGGRYVSFSTYWRSIRQFNALVRAMCRETGMMYIPVAERFNDGTYYFGDICHMKNEGIDLKAQVIFEAIREHVGERINRMGE